MGVGTPQMGSDGRGATIYILKKKKKKTAGLGFIIKKHENGNYTRIIPNTR